MQRLRLPHRLLIVAAVCLASAGLAAWLIGSRADAAPTFARDVQPIFDAKCVSCHPAAYPYLDLRRGRSYDELYRVAAATDLAFERVVPGKPALSYLLIHPPDPSNRGLLTSTDRATIARWIEAGARDD